MSRKRQFYIGVVSTYQSDSILNDLVSILQKGEILDSNAVQSAGTSLIDESASLEAKANFLSAWQERGETAEEVALLASFFRSHSRNPGLDSFAPQAIDIVGTGGDKSGTFNISTTASIIVAAGGVPVIKHGNRSITSKTGSADLLEALGIPLQADNQILRGALEATNFTFLFAPAFHPAFKSIVPVRKSMAAQGKQSVFNILGPLINPAKPHHQLLGVYNESMVMPLSQVLNKSEVRAGIVVCSNSNGQRMDEITSIGVNTVAPVGSVSTADLDELQKLILGKFDGRLDDLKGGDFETNLAIFRSVINFKANETLLNSICLNAGVAFKLVGKARTYEEGFEFAIELLKSGKVVDWVKATSNFYSSNL